MTQATQNISRPKKKIFWAALLVVSSVVCVLPVWLILHQIGRGIRESVAEADSGFKKATNSINPEDLRSWALENVRQKATRTELYRSMPENIRTLYSEPPDARVDGDILILMWGGGFFHWEIDVGPASFSETTGVDNHFTTLEWIPGIYYSREDKKHPFQ